MYSCLQQYPEMFLMHSRALVEESSHLGPNSLTLWARGICRWDSPPSQYNSWKYKTNHPHILCHYYPHF